MHTTDHQKARQQEAASAAAFTITQACQYASLSRSFLYKLFATGQLPRLKAGKRALILRTDLDAYLLSLREEAR
jgi:excisionase family DNA binding protein